MVLILSQFFLFVVLALSLSTYSGVMNHFLSIQKEIAARQSFWLAEAGFACALAKFSVESGTVTQTSAALNSKDALLNSRNERDESVKNDGQVSKHKQENIGEQENIDCGLSDNLVVTWHQNSVDKQQLHIRSSVDRVSLWRDLAIPIQEGEKVNWVSGSWRDFEE